jgi:N-acetylglucosaminyldiphosphoundecaprenol N-acetyl-beta-D-mannosaminyltransferase
MKALFFQLPIYTAAWSDFWSAIKKHLEETNDKHLKKTNNEHAKKANSANLLLIFTPNPEIIVQVDDNPALRQVLKEADFLLPDGVGLLMANRWIRFRQRFLFFIKKILSPKQAQIQEQVLMPAKISQKMAGVDLADKLLVEAAKKNYVSLIIGGRNYAKFWGKQGGEYQGEIFEDEKSLIKLKNNLYWTEAYQDKDEPLPIEDQAIERILKKVKPQIVFMALGSLDQEQWLVEWRARLEQAGVSLAIGVGGAFDLLFGRVARAPRFFRVLALEWLWRLIQQPWRWRRQLRLLKFLCLVRKEARSWQKMTKTQFN